MAQGSTSDEPPSGPEVTSEPEQELVSRALEVLDANWLGHGTKPSPRLYPHQWSWDAACIAMGRTRWDQDRAELEFRSLFAGQWRNGLLPHIVFTGGGRYFPGPEFWQTEQSPDSPGRLTSGIVQPPIHATAALRVYRRARDRERAEAFLAELLPQLEAWHAYLYRERTRGGGALVEIWHPWESGMDNSPLWDDALARLRPAPAELPGYRRVDVELADPAERPTDADYDRYVYLVGLFRSLRYDPERIRAACPFAIQPVLFNSLLVASNRDLAEIARLVGADPARYEEWAERTAAAIDTVLWDDERGLYVDYDVRGDGPVTTQTATGYAPLVAGVPGPGRARRLIEHLTGAAVRIDGVGRAITSLPPGDPRYDPSRYWRGPVWPILNWVVHHGLLRYGVTSLATEIRTALLELARRHGFWEHYSPVTGHGHGAEQFAWTAALVLDLAGDLSGEGEMRSPRASRSQTV